MAKFVATYRVTYQVEVDAYDNKKAREKFADMDVFTVMQEGQIVDLEPVSMNHGSLVRASESARVGQTL